MDGTRKGRRAEVLNDLVAPRDDVVGFDGEVARFFEARVICAMNDLRGESDEDKAMLEKVPEAKVQTKTRIYEKEGQDVGVRLRAKMRDRRRVTARANFPRAKGPHVSNGEDDKGGKR